MIANFVNSHQMLLKLYSFKLAIDSYFNDDSDISILDISIASIKCFKSFVYNMQDLSSIFIIYNKNEIDWLVM